MLLKDPLAQTLVAVSVCVTCPVREGQLQIFFSHVTLLWDVLVTQLCKTPWAVPTFSSHVYKSIRFLPRV